VTSRQGNPPSPWRLTAAVALAPWARDRVANVAAYDIPDLILVTDNKADGCWPTVRRAWQAGIDAGGTHHLVLTDDLTLADEFWQGLHNAVAARPADFLSLLTVRRGARDAVARGKHWCVSWGGLTGAANVLPSGLVADFLAWEQANIDPACPHDDVRLSAWCLQNQPRRRVYTPVPCLVDHGRFLSVIPDSPAFGTHHSPAAAFCTGDASLIDFTLGLDDPEPIGASVDRLDVRIRDEPLISRR
jgi:hypothetical protein